MSAMFDDEKTEAYRWRANTEARIEKLESDDIRHTADASQLKASSASKSDLADIKILIANLENHFSQTKVELKAEIKVQIAEAKASIIAWAVMAIFLAQLLPALLKLFLPS